MSSSSTRTTVLLTLILIIAAAALVLQFRLERKVNAVQDELGGRIARLTHDAEHREDYRTRRVVPPGKRDILYPAARTYRPGMDLAGFQTDCRARLMELTGLNRSLLASPVELTVLSSESLDSLGVVRKRVEFGFAGHDEWTLRGYLLYPTSSSGRLPGIICLNGHQGEAAAVAGIKADYTNGYGLGLAREGFLVLAFDWAFEAESSMTGPDGKPFHGHENLTDWISATGRSGISLYMENAWCALQALKSRPEADTTRLGVTGISRGGELTTYFAAMFAPEIDAYYASGAGFPFVYRRFGGGCKCTYVEEVFDEYEFSDLMVAAAPLPARLQLGVQDGIWGYWDNIEYIMRSVEPVYENLEAAGNLGLDIHGGKHVYDVAQGVAFFNGYLKN